MTFAEFLLTHAEAIGLIVAGCTLGVALCGFGSFD